MRIELPEHVKKIIYGLEAAGFEAYAVGGCVRDSILGRRPQDWDITTSARPEEVKALFSHTIDTGIAHGTVTIMMDHMGYEVTTYRIDGEYEDSRHPKEVIFTGELVKDLQRRDFTINAMAYNEEKGLVDAFDGMGDLKRGIIRCVGNPIERFTEDALRMLRAVRFAAQLGFTIEESTKNAIAKLASSIEKVSAERIQTELIKLLVSGHPEELKTAYELSLTKVFLPEFDVMMETDQKNKHHCYTVGQHTIVALCNVRQDKVLRLAILLHDVAKPCCITTDEKGQNHFKGHPAVGAKMTRDILKRLKFDNDTIDRVCVLVENHDERPMLTERNVRRAVNRVGTELFPLLLEVKEADTLAQSDYRREEKLSYIKEYRELFEKVIREEQCVKKSDMNIKGKDLIALGMKPGKDLGTVLDQLFEMVLEDPRKNTKENLIEEAHKLITPFI